ncbi:hypothetical protein Thermo_00096 [Thermoplasmatales archaeon]|nr:hypothetical protein Thermo_00096 [Thermoplasmatales archaeon]
MKQNPGDERNPYVGAVLIAGLIASIAILVYGLSGLI